MAQSGLLKNIVALAKIDVELFRVEAEKKKAATETKKRQDALRTLETQIQNKGKVVHDKRERLQKEEKLIADEQAKLIAQRKQVGTLGSAKTQQAAERNIEHVGRSLNQREEALLKLMDELKPLDEEVKKLQDALAGARTELQAFEKVCAENIAGAEERAAKVRDGRAPAAALIPPRELQLYDRTRERLPLDPVVPALETRCGCCAMALGPQVLVQVSREESLVRCPGCQRILYLADRV